MKKGEMQICKECGAEIGPKKQDRGPARTQCDACRAKYVAKYKIDWQRGKRRERRREKRKLEKYENIKQYFTCGRGDRYAEGMPAGMEDYCKGGTCRPCGELITRTFTR